MAAIYMLRRNRRFHFRIRVPSDLAPFIGCSEIQRTLRTSDRKLARSMAQTLRANAETLFATLHHHRLLGMGEEQLRETARSLMLAQLPPVQTRAHHKLAGRPNGSTPLSEAIEQFVADRLPAWEPKTALMNRASLKLFLDYLGDRPIRSVGRDDCRSFRDLLTKLPPNVSKRFKGKPLDEVAAMGLPPMSAKTINRNLGAVSALLNWSVREGLITENPARGLNVPRERNVWEQRDVFSPDELRLLFERSPLYSGCKSERERHLPGKLIIRDAKFWLPLIGLYSGMRLEEIAQLQTGDVRQVDGVWVFDVRHGNGKKLKTMTSERLVPIHPKLIELGILEHRASVAAEGHEHLWPELVRSSDGFYSSAFSKWFGRYKREIGIKRRTVTFHSFRHTFINRLKQAGANESQIKELVGHKDQSITMSRYGKRYEPAALLATLKSLQFGLALEPLRPIASRHNAGAPDHD